jgi:hypothetical protein
MGAGCSNIRGAHRNTVSAAAFWLPDRLAKAVAVFFAGMVPGLGLGIEQQMCGTHF